MAARYRERHIGVYDTETQRILTARGTPDAWADYLKWLSVDGNVPDPLPVVKPRDLAAENKTADAIAAIQRLEKSQARALRELIIGTPEEKAAAEARLREIETGIKHHRVQISALDTQPPNDRGDKHRG